MFLIYLKYLELFLYDQDQTSALHIVLDSGKNPLVPKPHNSHFRNHKCCAKNAVHSIYRHCKIEFSLSFTPLLHLQPVKLQPALFYY